MLAQKAHPLKIFSRVRKFFLVEHMVCQDPGWAQGKFFLLPPPATGIGHPGPHWPQCVAPCCCCSPALWNPAKVLLGSGEHAAHWRGGQLPGLHPLSPHGAEKSQGELLTYLTERNQCGVGVGDSHGKEVEGGRWMSDRL